MSDTKIKDNDDDVEDNENERQRCGLEKLHLQTIDGVNYFKFSLGNVSHLLELVRNLNIRHDDVVTVGFPRSGNHWTFEVVSMILNQTTKFEKDHFYSRLLESLGDNVAAIVDRIQPPRNLTTHCRTSNIPHQVIQKQTKIIYVLRNPKDVLVSVFNFVRSLSHTGSKFTGSWDEFFDLEMRGEFPWGYWFDHVLSTEAFQAAHPDVPMLILVYEKMKENPIEELQKLCEFLEKPKILCEQIAEVTQFSRMKMELGATKMAVQSNNHFTNGPGDILRKGVIGDWKNWFSSEQNKEFNKLFEEKMATSKLSSLIRKYIQ